MNAQQIAMNVLIVDLRKNLKTTSPHFTLAVYAPTQRPDGTWGAEWVVIKEDYFTTLFDSPDMDWQYIPSLEGTLRRVYRYGLEPCDWFIMRNRDGVVLAQSI